MFDYGMMGRDVMSAPIGLSVVAMVKLSPRPKAKAATSFFCSVERRGRAGPGSCTRRPSSAPRGPGQDPAAFIGVVPFYPGGVDDVGLKAILAAVGHPDAALEIRIVGDDGGVLADGTLSVDWASGAGCASTVSTLLDQALALAKTPTRCHKLAN